MKQYKVRDETVYHIWLNNIAKTLSSISYSIICQNQEQRDYCISLLKLLKPDVPMDIKDTGYPLFVRWAASHSVEIVAYTASAGAGSKNLNFSDMFEEISDAGGSPIPLSETEQVSIIHSKINFHVIQGGT